MMTTHPRLRFVVLALLSAALGLAAHAKVTALVGGRLIDGWGGAPVSNAVILIEGERIKAVGTAETLPVPAGAEVIDTRGMSLMPGLWDNHVHFGGGPALIDENRNLLPLYLAHGITTVRDAAGDLSDSVLEWRTHVADGTLLGPTIFTSLAWQARQAFFCSSCSGDCAAGATAAPAAVFTVTAPRIGPTRRCWSARLPCASRAWSGR